MILDFTFCTVPVFLRDAGIRTTTAAGCATNEQHTHQLVQSVSNYKYIQVGAQCPDHQPELPLLLLRPGEESLEGHVQGHPLEAHRLQEHSEQEGTPARGGKQRRACAVRKEK